jgi:maleylpyruvate isomerase
VSLTPREKAARAALRARQGKGARYDAPSAPADDLLLARRATALFARQLNELSDAELDMPSAWADRPRRHPVAVAGYQARMLAELVAWAREGREGPFPRRAEVDPEEIAWGMSLPSHALRNLVRHAVVHLDVEWRDLSDRQWDQAVTDVSGTAIPIRATPLMRARALRELAMKLEGGLDRCRSA